ncbi:MAG: glutamyl-tRNA reductase [Campylobacterales bacterium]
MHYSIVSFTHKNCDILTRERLALDSDEKKASFLGRLNSADFINESMVLSTCNRVEVIVNTRDHFRATDRIFNEIANYSNIDISELEGRADIYEDNGAIHHLFSVASSLDSLVVGETQISGQLKDAFKFSFENGFCSQKLSRVAHFAFKCSAEVRNCTGISKTPVSVASAAVVKAMAIYGTLEDRFALVIGAGEMSLLAAKHLVGHGAKVVVVNRDIERGREIVDEIGKGCEARAFSELKELLNSYPLLFTATSAPHHIITKDMIEKREFARFWFDLAVPKDIATDIECDNIEVVEVDDLQDIVSKNMALRQEQAKEAYKIVGRYSHEFYKWLKTLSIDPVIKRVRKTARDSSFKEIERAISKGYIPKEYEHAVKKVLHSAFNSFLHTPTTVLKDISKEPHADTVIESLKVLFDIKDDVGREFKMLDKYKCEEHTSNSRK